MNSQINGLIEAFATRSAIPQLNVKIWHRGNSFEGSFGSDPHLEVDVFEIGSVSKTFTASLLAILIEKNIVALSDKVSKFQPDLPFAKDITLLQLATHTSGLPNNPFKGLILNARKALSEFSHADYNEYLEGVKKPLKTGKVSYSNLGMALLGNLLAGHLGMSYENAVKEHLLTPLGMTDTHISPEAYDAKRVAIGHGANGKAAPHFLWSSMEPAGVWRSTTKDMTMYLKAHLDHSGESWASLLRKTSLPVFEDPKRAQQGLAWQLASIDALGDHAWHNGQTFGQKSIAVFAKNSDAAVIILSNRIPKLWQHFFGRYSIEQLAFEVLESLVGSK